MIAARRLLCAVAAEAMKPAVMGKTTNVGC